MTQTQALGAAVCALMQLLDVLGIDDPRDVSVNFDGHDMRLDIARLTPDGRHIAEVVAGFNADPLTETFGQPVLMPDPGGVSH